MRKRNSVGNIILIALVLLCCIFAPGCSPTNAEAAEQLQPVQFNTTATAVAANEEKNPTPGLDVTVAPLQTPDFIVEIEQQERLVASTYALANEYAQQDRPETDALLKMGAKAEKDLARLINALKDEQHEIYSRYRR